MKKGLSLWQFGGFVFTCVAGTLLHFLYDWSNHSIVITLFSAVNESIWEHMKLLFFPMLVFAFIEYRYIGRDYENYWCVKLIGIGSGLLVIPTIYYTYTGILGKSADWFNIAIFFIAAAIAYWPETQFLKASKPPCVSFAKPIILLSITALLFVLFTFFPPHIPLFQDPITQLYGIF